MKTETVSYQLEQLIDKITLPQIIEKLADICNEKASHLRENWQDEKSARTWDKNANLLNNISGKLYS